MAEDFGEKLRLSGVVFVRHQRGADADGKRFLFFPMASRSLKNASAASLEHAARVFRKAGCVGDADRFHFVAGKLVAGLGIAEHGDGVRKLLCIPGSVEANKCRDGADFWFFLGRCGKDRRGEKEGSKQGGIPEDAGDCE